ncbi:DUF4238 domain-containing protein [Aurantimonas endophytica]|uniref:DUF4238 domain-containing protein n=1 Tax=Aurantimonas endophytica TaxID=1522175 RepID=UPI001AED4729|nr:DUF4238 domain-containing protein [Aurantimonas endophytica]
MNGFEPAEAQQVEEKFFKLVDTWASGALDMLEKHGHDAPWDAKSRSAWTRFIVSLLLRSPEDVALFREWWHEDFRRTDEAAEAGYREVRGPSDPETFSEYLQGQSLSIKEKHQFEILISLIDHDGVGEAINKMHWRVLRVADGSPRLLTSDSPILRTSSLKATDGHLALPIGPRLLFIVSPDKKFLERVLKASNVELAKEVNRQVVEGANRFVYGHDASQLRFIQNRFGKSPQRRLMADLIKMRSDPSSRPISR